MRPQKFQKFMTMHIFDHCNAKVPLMCFNEFIYLFEHAFLWVVVNRVKNLIL